VLKVYIRCNRATELPPRPPRPAPEAPPRALRVPPEAPLLPLPQRAGLLLPVHARFLLAPLRNDVSSAVVPPWCGGATPLQVVCLLLRCLDNAAERMQHQSML